MSGEEGGVRDGEGNGGGGGRGGRAGNRCRSRGCIVVGDGGEKVRSGAQEQIKRNGGGTTVRVSNLNMKILNKTNPKNVKYLKLLAG